MVFVLLIWYRFVKHCSALPLSYRSTITRLFTIWYPVYFLWHIALLRQPCKTNPWLSYLHFSQSDSLYLDQIICLLCPREKAYNHPRRLGAWLLNISAMVGFLHIHLSGRLEITERSCRNYLYASREYEKISSWSSCVPLIVLFNCVPCLP